MSSSPHGLALADGVNVALCESCAATLQTVTRISVGDYPEGIETSANGKSVYVVNWFSNEVWAIDAGTLKVTAKMPAGDGPRAFGTFLREPP